MSKNIKLLVKLANTLTSSILIFLAFNRLKTCKNTKMLKKIDTCWPV